MFKVLFGRASVACETAEDAVALVHLMEEYALLQKPGPKEAPFNAALPGASAPAAGIRALEPSGSHAPRLSVS